MRTNPNAIERAALALLRFQIGLLRYTAERALEFINKMECSK